MPHTLSGRRPVALSLWILCFAAIPVWSHFDHPAWDVTIYLQAVHSLHLGHDPYADAIAIQRLFHSQLAFHPDAIPPFSYVYSPITLPVLRAVARVPLLLSGSIYWLFYLAGVLAQVWVGMQAVDHNERRYFVYFAPLAAFFPGFLGSDILLSGNIAYILYGLVLVTAVIGWRTERWLWFYLAILAASCFKAPLLSLVVIPILSARKQWIPTALAAAAGLGLFAMQPLLWPSLFQHYLQAVELQFSYNRDFGCSPAGLFSELLVSHGFPYSPGSFLFYLCYAIPTFALLLYLSRQFLRGGFTLRQWIPILLVGVILLNPRLIEYDVAPIALPLALIAWRFFAARTSERKTLFFFATLFLAINAVAVQSWNIWKLIDGPLLVAFFLTGAWSLVQQSRNTTETGNRSRLHERELAFEDSSVPALQFQATEGL
jgi:hypothetical protein